MRALGQSVELGYKDYNNMVNDNDLRSLRKDKKYLSLLAQVNDRQPLRHHRLYVSKLHILIPPTIRSP